MDSSSAQDQNEAVGNSSATPGEDVQIQCPICLRAVPRTRDAFLEPCFHAFCGECLRSWIRTESARGPDSQMRCPVCRTPAEARIFSLDNDAFDRQLLPSAADRCALSSMPTLAMTPQHVRRRQAYSEACLAAHTDVCCCHGVPSTSGHDRSATKVTGVASDSVIWLGAKATARHPDDPTLLAWVLRELQSLLLCDEPGTAQQIALHTLRAGLRCTSGSQKRSGKRVALSAAARKSIHHATASAMELFLGNPNSCKFACFLVSFLSSVDSMATWDRTQSQQARFRISRRSASASRSRSRDCPHASQLGSGLLGPSDEGVPGCVVTDTDSKHLLLGDTDDEAPSDAETDPG